MMYRVMHYIKCLWLFHSVYKMSLQRPDQHYIGLVYRGEVPCIALAMSFDRKAWELGDFIKENMQCRTTHS